MNLSRRNRIAQMTTRAQIAKIARKIEALEAAGPGMIHVPVYHPESEDEALAFYRDEFAIDPSDPRHIAFNHVCRSETREDCKWSGLHILYSIGPDTLEEILGEVDGKTRGIPTPQIQDTSV